MDFASRSDRNTTVNMIKKSNSFVMYDGVKSGSCPALCLSHLRSQCSGFYYCPATQRCAFSVIGELPLADAGTKDEICTYNQSESFVFIVMYRVNFRILRESGAFH